MSEHTLNQKIYLTLRAVERGVKKPRDLTKEEYKRIIEYLYRKAYVYRDVATGDYHINERGVKLMGIMKEAE
jgi:hypothetical protein